MIQIKVPDEIPKPSGSIDYDGSAQPKNHKKKRIHESVKTGKIFDLSANASGFIDYDNSVQPRKKDRKKFTKGGNLKKKKINRKKIIRKEFAKGYNLKKKQSIIRGHKGLATLPQRVAASGS